MASSALVKEMFLEALTESTYDVTALCEATGLVGRGEDLVTTHDLLYTHFYEFFSDCLDGDFNEDRLVACVAATPLEAMADKYLAVALQRLSESNGLPADGHVLHTVLQAKAAFLHFGPDRCVRVRPLDQTESDWQLASHRGSVFVVGDSAAGKDTVMRILDTLDTDLKTALGDMECFNVVKVGHPTYNGLLSALKKGVTSRGTCVLVWYNSEIQVCPGNKETSIREEDLC